MTSNRLAQVFARALMALGLGVGVIAVCFWAFDIRIEVPAWMWRIAIAKLTLAGALGLLGAGAMLLRYLRRKEPRADAHVGTRTPDESLPLPNWASAPRPKEKAPAIRTDSSRHTP